MKKDLRCCPARTITLSQDNIDSCVSAQNLTVGVPEEETLKAFLFFRDSESGNIVAPASKPILAITFEG